MQAPDTGHGQKAPSLNIGDRVTAAGRGHDLQPELQNTSPLLRAYKYLLQVDGI